jgi:hypothetical protein
MDLSYPKLVKFTFKDDMEIKININELLRLKTSILKNSSIFFRLLGIDNNSPFKEVESTKVFKSFEITSEHWNLVIKFIRKGIVLPAIIYAGESTFKKINLLNEFNSIFSIPSLTDYINKYVEKINIFNEKSYEKETSYNPMNPKEDYLKKYIWIKSFSHPRLHDNIFDKTWSFVDTLDNSNNLYRQLIK